MLLRRGAVVAVPVPAVVTDADGREGREGREGRTPTGIPRDCCGHFNDFWQLGNVIDLVTESTFGVDGAVVVWVLEQSFAQA